MKLYGLGPSPRRTRKKGPRTRVLWGGSASSSFTPSDLANLVAWYSADSGAYSDAGTTLATNGQSVAQWNDRSGNGYNLAFVVAGPTLNTTSLNGRSALVFASASSTRMVSGTDAVNVTGTAVSVFVVGKMATATPNFGRVVSFLGTGQALDWNNNSSFSLNRNGTSDSIVMTCNSGSGADATANMTVDASHRFGGTLTTNSAFAYVDNVAGTEDASGPAPNFTVGTLSIGLGAGAFWDGPVAEIVIVKAVLSSSNRSSLDGYFTNKYGL